MGDVILTTSPERWMERHFAELNKWIRLAHATFMMDSQNGHQTRITDEQLLEDCDRICRVLRARQIWSTDIADDLFQEVYIALHRARNLYDPRLGEWKDYAFRKAQFAIKDYFRKAPNWNRHTNERIDLVSTDAEALPEHAVGVSYQGTPLEWELERFTEKEQKMILLLIAGYSLKEIAGYLNIGTSYIYHLIENLRIVNSPYSFSHLTDSAQLKQVA